MYYSRSYSDWNGYVGTKDEWWRPNMVSYNQPDLYGVAASPPAVVVGTQSTANGIGFSPGNLMVRGWFLGIALVCLVAGSFGLLNFVEMRIRKKKLIESAITMRKAARFLLLLPLLVILGFLCAVAVALAIHDIFSEPGFKTIKYFFRQYIVLISCVALTIILKPVFSSILKRLPIGERFPRLNNTYVFSLKKGRKETEEGDLENAQRNDSKYLMKLEFDTHFLVALPFCLCAGVLYNVSNRHWIASDLLSVALCICSIRILHFASFQVCAVILPCSFAFGIIALSATDAVSSVVRYAYVTFDCPLFLKFPKDIFRSGLCSDECLVYGVFDIIIPGVVIALLLRFDRRVDCREGTAYRCYFLSSLAAYIMGYWVSAFVEHVYKVELPLLLYLVLACFGVPVIVALLRGEFKKLWFYSEEHLVATERQGQ